MNHNYEKDTIVATIGEYYKPFDTVNLLNNNIKSKGLKKIVNICLLVAGSILFIFTGLALYDAYKYGFDSVLDIRLYLIALSLMLFTDVIAVGVEGIEIKNNIESNMKPLRSDWISIFISIIVGAVTFYLMLENWGKYKIGIMKTKPDFIIIATMKMIVSGIIAFRAGQKLLFPDSNSLSNSPSNSPSNLLSNSS